MSVRRWARRMRASYTSSPSKLSAPYNAGSWGQGIAYGNLYIRIDEYEIECDKRDVGSITLSMFEDRAESAHEDVKAINAAFGMELEVPSRKF